MLSQHKRKYGAKYTRLFVPIDGLAIHKSFLVLLTCVFCNVYAGDIHRRSKAMSLALIGIWRVLVKLISFRSKGRSWWRHYYCLTFDCIMEIDRWCYSLFISRIFRIELQICTNTDVNAEGCWDYIKFNYSKLIRFLCGMRCYNLKLLIFAASRWSLPEVL